MSSYLVKTSHKFSYFRIGNFAQQFFSKNLQINNVQKSIRNVENGEMQRNTAVIHIYAGFCDSISDRRGACKNAQKTYENNMKSDKKTKNY